MCIRPITLHSLTNLYISAWFNPHNIHRTQWYWLMNSEHNGYLFCFKITAELFDILTPAEAGPWDPGQHRGSLGGRQLACIPLPALCPLTWWGMLRRRQSAKHTFQTEHWASQVAHPQFCGGLRHTITYSYQSNRDEKNKCYVKNKCNHPTFYFLQKQRCHMHVWCQPFPHPRTKFACVTIRILVTCARP